MATGMSGWYPTLGQPTPPPAPSGGGGSPIASYLGQNVAHTPYAAAPPTKMATGGYIPIPSSGIDPGGGQGLMGNGSWGNMRIPWGDQLKTADQLQSGYAPTGNAALDNYNATVLAPAIANERYWEQYGMVGARNPGAAAAGNAKDPNQMVKGVARNMALGMNYDPTGGGATTNIASQLANLQATGGYHAQNVGVNTGPQDQTRGMQTGNLGALRDASMGNGPSAAQGVLQGATDQNIAQQMAMAASARGVNNGAAQLMARNQGVLTQQASGQQAAVLAAQEQQAARQLYTGALSDTRGQDLTLSGQQLQAGVANQSAGIQAQNLNQTYSLGLLGDQYQYAALNQKQQQEQMAALMNQSQWQDTQWQQSMGRKGRNYPMASAGAQGAGAVIQGAATVLAA